MATVAASILLMMMVSLETLLLLVAAGTSAVAAVSGSGSGGTIRLPSHASGVAVADLVRAMARVKQGDKDSRPWECCDSLLCTKSLPMFCYCFDEVERCSDACKECEQTGSRYMCNDRYEWFPGDDPMPRCHEYGNARGVGDPGKIAAAAVRAYDRKKAGGGDEKRPWKCCDVPICTRSFPPVCHCADTVERCASTCERCEQVEEDSSGGGPRYRCLDQHQGDPGPSCRKEAGRGDHDWARRLARGLHRFSSYA